MSTMLEAHTDEVLGKCTHCLHEVRATELTTESFLAFEATGLGPECQALVAG